MILMGVFFVQNVHLYKLGHKKIAILFQKDSKGVLTSEISHIWKLFRIFFIFNPILMGYFSLNWLYWELPVVSQHISYSVNVSDINWKGPKKCQFSRFESFSFVIQFECILYFFFTKVHLMYCFLWFNQKKVLKRVQNSKLGKYTEMLCCI